MFTYTTGPSSKGDKNLGIPETIRVEMDPNKQPIIHYVYMPCQATWRIVYMLLLLLETQVSSQCEEVRRGAVPSPAPFCGELIGLTLASIWIIENLATIMLLG